MLPHGTFQPLAGLCRSILTVGCLLCKEYIFHEIKLLPSLACRHMHTRRPAFARGLVYTGPLLVGPPPQALSTLILILYYKAIHDTEQLTMLCFVISMGVVSFPAKYFKSQNYNTYLDKISLGKHTDTREERKGKNPNKCRRPNFGPHNPNCSFKSGQTLKMHNK